MTWGIPWAPDAFVFASGFVSGSSRALVRGSPGIPAPQERGTGDLGNGDKETGLQEGGGDGVGIGQSLGSSTWLKGP
ncbi:hypothetical protein E4U27_003708 [Claviceps purpurea]|nr:hypothetical protein E4U27_003708 [Claviceps purpurea]